jgi:hypothetical protein
MKAVWIKDNKVIDLSVWTEDSVYPADIQILVVEDDAIIGLDYLYDGKTFFRLEDK